MLRPTMLRYVALACCDRLAGALTDKCVYRYRQSNVRRLLPASDHCRARGNPPWQIVGHNSDNATVLGSSRMLGGAVENLIDSSEKRILILESACY